MLTRLIYTSQISGEFTTSDIRAILETSAKNNTISGITGVLYFGENSFFQCLEGERIEVNQTYNRIIPDTRHKNSILLSYTPANERLFADWDMAYLNSADENLKNILKKYSNRNEFQVSQLSDRQSDNLIIDFSKTLAEIKRSTF